MSRQLGKADSFWAARPDSVKIALVVVLILTLAYWLWFSLTQRSLDGPDTLSALGAAGIVEHGLQRFPSGFLYHRGYIPHYLLAGSFLAFGVNNFSTALPSLLMGLGTLWLVYLFGRDVLNRPWLGVAAAALLSLLQEQTFYATGPRMYMALEFFTILAAYCAWRGYVKGSARFQFFTFLALAAALLSNREAVLLVVAIPAALLAVIWATHQKMPKLVSPVTLVGVLVLGLVGYFMFVFPFPGHLPSVAYDGGRTASRIGLSLGLLPWAKHLLNVELAFPYAPAFVPLALLGVYRAGINRQLGVVSGVLYLIVLGAVSGSLVLIGSSELFGTRLWLFILPFLALLFCSGAVVLLEGLGWVGTAGFNKGKGKLRTALAILLLGVLLSFAVAFLARDGRVFEVISEGYGVPCSGQDCDKQIERMYAQFAPELRPWDLVISSRPSVTNHYLGRVDLLLRKKTAKVKILKLEEHFGLPVVDSAEELSVLFSGDRKVWVIAHSNINDALETAAYNYLDGSFQKFQSHQLMTIYVNSLE